MPYAQVQGVSLRYRIEGDGPDVLVLLHEMGGSLESWDAVVPMLTHRYRVLRYDVRGAGGSEKTRAPFSIDDLTGDLGGLLDQLECHAPVALAGCAVGAAQALRFAARHGTRVTRVVAMAPATGMTAERRTEALALADLFERQGVRERIAARFDHAYPAHYFADSLSRAAVFGRLMANDPYTYAATYRMLCALDMTLDLPRITCPVLVVAGRHDTTRPAAGLQQLASDIPGASFSLIDSGHAMPILSPERVAGEMLGFLT
jgi:3-oxoadipate enol-lactonase